jgi:hypothetical protein
MHANYSDDIIARLATGLEAGDREPFRQAAEAAVFALPPAMVGPGRHGRYNVGRLVAAHGAE